jgi:three-Cys-motif partner protein
MKDKSADEKTLARSLTAPLFPDFDPGASRRVRTYKRIEQPIWTENKAQFIRHYLRYFVQITKHGVYIDGFAGPQSFDHLDAWSAALVLDSDPKWLRSFFLCELSARGVKALQRLVEVQSDARDKKGRMVNRKIEVLPGDFNQTIGTVLCNGKIAQKEATFCLLDQRTFECHWATLERLAAFKQPPHNKIELLYFLGVGWIHRAFAGIRDTEKLLRWWGRTGWEDLKGISSWDIAQLVRLRFEKELGYHFAAAYPIFDRDEGNRIMYYMIHASDHEEAPALMVRAHSRAVRALPQETQCSLNFPDVH